MTGGAGFSRDSESNQVRNLGYLDNFKANHFKRSHYKITKKKLYSYKAATPEQLSQIKDEIRAEERQYRQKSRVLLIVLVLFAIAGVTLLLI